MMAQSTIVGMDLQKSASRLLSVIFSRLVDGVRFYVIIEAFDFVCGAFYLGRKLNTGMIGTSSSLGLKARVGTHLSSIGNLE